MGQPVPNVKDNVSRDILSPYVHDNVMTANLTLYKEAFCARLRGVRKAAGYTQEQMAKKLDITRDNYAKYETRSPLRHDLIAEVAKITGHDTWFLLTGRPRQDEKTRTPRQSPRLKSV